MQAVPSPAPEAPGFAALEARVRAAVHAVAGSDPNPADPFRGLYVSDDLALSLAAGGDLRELDDRLALACERLGLDALAAAVLGLCAAPELDPRYGRLYAYLQDDVTRKLASPRASGLVAIRCAIGSSAASAAAASPASR
jgi:hypothetical protein